MDLIARQRFAQAVKELRKAKNHRQFAQIVGVSHPTIGLWERAEVSPTRENLERIALMRGETPDQFMDYLEGRTQPLAAEERLLKQIQVASPSQLAMVLRAIASRLELDE